MAGGQVKNPGARAAQPGLDNRFADAAGNPRVARKRRVKEAGTPYRVTPSAGESFRIVVSGRIRWALDRLRAAGTRGCTPITEPAPRWAAYIHSLRDMGVRVETITEAHGGAFAGHHARYVLRDHAAPDWLGAGAGGGDGARA